MMTQTEIRQRLADIEAMKGDDESAHAEEDRLYLDFIQSLADSNEVPEHIRELAAEVATATKISFYRWCA